jgi:hypothetical protein
VIQLSLCVARCRNPVRAQGKQVPLELQAETLDPHLYSGILHDTMPFDWLKPRPGPKTLSLCQAEAIVSAFGDSVIQLADFRKRQLLDKAPAVWTLPLQQLRHSKWNIQVGLAIIVANLVCRRRARPSESTSQLLRAASQSCKELAWFTREPAVLPVTESSPLGIRLSWDADAIYESWTKFCEARLDFHVEMHGSDANLTRIVQTEYWSTVDGQMPEFMANRVLEAIRET